MSDDWEAEDFDLPTPVVPVSDKWEGEDEEEPVKESWEDDDEEKKEVKVASTTAPSKKKTTKKLEEKIREKEQKAREEAEMRRRNEEANLTPEQQLEEKLRRQKLVEESDFELTKETFGVSGSKRDGSIDDAEPTTKDQFAELRNNLVKKLQSLSLQENYNDFAEELIRDLCVGLDVEVLKKISNTTKSLHEEKLRMSKAAKGGKKGKTKVVLKMDKETDLYGDDFGGGDYDDFM